VQDCAIYGLAYVRHDPHRRYRATIMNFEPISRESWQVPPESSIYEVTKISYSAPNNLNRELHTESLCKIFRAIAERRTCLSKHLNCGPK
jgi:hypothetical protein